MIMMKYNTRYSQLDWPNARIKALSQPKKVARIDGMDRIDTAKMIGITPDILTLIGM